VVGIALEEGNAERLGEGGADGAFTATADAHDDPAVGVAGLEDYIAW
jgi:hypothetical protein